MNKVSITLLLISLPLVTVLGSEIPSQTWVDSTLEVLDGTKLGPSNNMMCGPACLYIAYRCLGLKGISLDDIAKMSNWNPMDGTSMLGLEEACDGMGLHTEAVELNTHQLEQLMNINGAFAVFESQQHFYLLLKARKGKFLTVTTPVDPKWFPAEKISALWDGKALLFSRHPINVETSSRKILFLAGLGGFCLTVTGCICVLLKKYLQQIAK